MNGSARPPQPVPRRVAVAAHPRLPEALEAAQEIAAWLQAAGLQAATGLLGDEALRRGVMAGAFDLMIALGGDGTVLRAGHLCGPSGVPLLGINLGRLGFLSEIRPQQWPDIAPRLLAGDYWLEQRLMLTAEHRRGEELLGTWEVVNEVVVTRGYLVRPVQLVAHLDGFLLTTYVADALIAATPTGSTAYALAAGGPILPPDGRNIVLVAVAPHLSLDRAIVLADYARVSITVYTDHEAVLSIDGQPAIALNDGDRIAVRASQRNLQFVRFQERDYFYRNINRHMQQNPVLWARQLEKQDET